MLKKVKIYSDGSCLGNPGPGGYCSILMYDNGGKTEQKILSGGERMTTNNKMELTAVITALSALKSPCEADIFTDSKYVVDGITKGWAKSWQKNNWIKKSDNKPALNADLWEKLLDLTAVHTTVFHWLKGHAGNPENELCDSIARSEAAKF